MCVCVCVCVSLGILLCANAKHTCCCENHHCLKEPKRRHDTGFTSDHGMGDEIVELQTDSVCGELLPSLTSELLEHMIFAFMIICFLLRKQSSAFLLWLFVLLLTEKHDSKDLEDLEVAFNN